MYKAQDIYIIKPVKLIKQTTYKKYYFPYSILQKLGLIETNRYNRLLLPFKHEGFILKLKYKIEKKLPKHVHDSALIYKEQYFDFNHNNLSFGLVKDPLFAGITTKYKDILLSQEYKVFNSYIRTFYMLTKKYDKDLVVINSIYKPETLASYLTDYKTNESQKDFEQRYKKNCEKEYTIDELKTLKEKLISKEQDSSYIIELEETQNFIGAPFYNTAHAYNKNGEKIYPTSKTKVKKIY